MAVPLPVISKDLQGADLARMYLDLDRSSSDGDAGLPGLLVTLPPAWGNKYQVLLYEAAARHRMAVVGVRTPADLEKISWPGPVLLHAHWFAALFNAATSEAGAQARLAEAQAQIMAFRERTGAKLVWTAHNVFPHGNAFPETFLLLRQWIFETFDAIHVMHEDHVPLLEEAFGRKAPPHFCVPHMTYAGIMPDTVDRAAARARYALPDTAFVFGIFGSVQAYKRIPECLEVIEEMARTRPVAALVGGIPTEADAVRAIEQRWGRAPWLRFAPRDIPDHEVQYIYRASDRMVLPYGDTLNSGAALMAASFRTPFLMPRGASTLGLEGSGADLFDPSAPDALRQAILAAPDTAPAVCDPAWLAQRSPATVSQAFMGHVHATLDVLNNKQKWRNFHRTGASPLET